MQERLRECYIKEGVNHLENCKDLREALWKKIHTPNYGAPGPPMGVRTPAYAQAPRAARSPCLSRLPMPAQSARFM